MAVFDDAIFDPEIFDAPPETIAGTWTATKDENGVWVLTIPLPDFQHKGE